MVFEAKERDAVWTLCQASKDRAAKALRFGAKHCHPLLLRIALVLNRVLIETQYLAMSQPRYQVTCAASHELGDI